MQNQLAEENTRRVEEEHPFYLMLIRLSVLAFPPVFLVAILWPAWLLWHAGYGAWPLLLLPLGLLASDFTSGMFHWFFDNYGSPETPVFGQTIELFRVHHALPEDICKSNFTFTVGHISVWAVPLVVSHLLPFCLGQPPLLYCAWTMLFSTANLFLIYTNLFHKWAHLPQKPGWMLWLQERHLILNMEHHQVHHTPPFETYYCITTGWMNPLLYKLKFFPRLEALLDKLGCPKSEGAGKLIEHLQKEGISSKAG